MCACVFVGKHFISTDLEHVNVVKNIANFIMQINKLFYVSCGPVLSLTKKGSKPPCYPVENSHIVSCQYLKY